MNFKNRWVWVGLLVLVILLLTLWAAPQSKKLQHGSTYSRAPAGYGAWYAYMEQQKLSIQRWQRPLDKLPASDQLTPPVKQVGNWIKGQGDQAAQAQPFVPLTLLQINSGFSKLSIFNEEWVKRGNVLVLIGETMPVTKAPFRTAIESSVGPVKVETTRRYSPAHAPWEERQSSQLLLSDTFGTVVWERPLGQGRVIYAVTPYLAANAYQDEPGNFKFLAQLVSEPGYPIYVDEYLHGYRDKETIAAEQSKGLIGYLAKTPLLLLAIQATVLFLVLIWGQNQRLGPPKRLVGETIDNSEAYIQALAGVLQKANCSDFVVGTIGKAEQLQIQRALGLGANPVDPQTIVEAWVQQTGRPAREMQTVLAPVLKAERLSDQALLRWLDQLQMVRRQLE